MYKYQNVSKEVQTVVRDGNISPRVVKPGESVVSSVAIENPNFKYLGEVQEDSASVNGTQVKQDTAVTEVETATNVETNKEQQ